MNKLSKLSLVVTLFAAYSAAAIQILPLSKQLEAQEADQVSLDSDGSEDMIIQGFDDLDVFREAADDQEMRGAEGLLQYVRDDGPGQSTGKELRIVINKKEQTLVVYENGDSVFESKIPVSTGGGLHIPRNGQPPVCGITPAGDFRFQLTNDRFFTNYFSKKYEAWVKWAVHIHDGVFMHQAPTAQAEKIIGRPASGGCIRMRSQDAKRVYLYLAQNKGEMLTVSVVGDDRKELAKCQNSAAFKAAMDAYQSGDADANLIERRARSANRSQAENHPQQLQQQQQVPRAHQPEAPASRLNGAPVIKGLKALWPFKAL